MSRHPDSQGFRPQEEEMGEGKEFCKQVPPIYESFIKVFGGHAVGDQILGPTKNPCPTFFTSAARGDVWSSANWGYYPKTNDVVRIPLQPVKRLIAIGDFHGDLTKARQALEIAKLLGKDDKWIGGKSVLVQVGDVFDRGPHEIKIWYLLEKLRRDAYRHGGAVHVLHGNHETLNLLGKFKYVSEKGYREFASWNKWYHIQNHLREMVDGCSPPVDYNNGLPNLSEVVGLKEVNFKSKVGMGLRARLIATRIGGPMATEFLASCPTVLVIGKSMFVHGGIQYMQTLGGYPVLNGYNLQVSQWVKGKAGFAPPAIINLGISRTRAITWNRELGTEDGTDQNIPCSDLHKLLSTLGLKRLLVGHTIQRTRLINSACDEQVIRLDTGMSGGCLDNPPQVLEILDDEHCFVLSTKGRIPLSECDKVTPRQPGPDEEDIAYRIGKEQEKQAKKKSMHNDSSKKSAEEAIEKFVKLDISEHTNEDPSDVDDSRDGLRDKEDNDSEGDRSSGRHKRHRQEYKQTEPVEEALDFVAITEDDLADTEGGDSEEDGSSRSDTKQHQESKQKEPVEKPEKFQVRPYVPPRSAPLTCSVI